MRFRVRPDGQNEQSPQEYTLRNDTAHQGYQPAFAIYRSHSAPVQAMGYHIPAAPKHRVGPTGPVLRRICLDLSTEPWRKIQKTKARKNHKDNRDNIGRSGLEISKLRLIPVLRPVQSKGRIVGQTLPVKPKHVRGSRIQIELVENHQDAAHFNMTIDSELLGCDLARMKVVDAMTSGTTKKQASVLQSKT